MFWESAITMTKGEKRCIANIKKGGTLIETGNESQGNDYCFPF
jgi:hypothetical protein